MLSRQREYKVAALQAKQSNDVERAKHHYLTAKVTTGSHSEFAPGGGGGGLPPKVSCAFPAETGLTAGGAGSWGGSPAEFTAASTW